MLLIGYHFQNRLLCTVRSVRNETVSHYRIDAEQQQFECVVQGAGDGMNFWLGLLIGGFVGTALGVLVMCLMSVAGGGEE